MLIAKIQLSPAKSVIAEVLRIGLVKFDPRPDWALVRWPVGDRPMRTHVVWMHPDDTLFIWVREFNFKERQ